VIIPKNSSTWRFFLYTLFCFLIIVGFVTGIYLYVSYQREKDHLEDNLRLVNNVHLQFIISSLWVTDYDALEKQLEAVSFLKYIQRVEVSDDEGNTYSAGGRKDIPLEVISRDLVYEHRDAKISIGSLFLYIDRHLMRAELLRGSLVVLAVQAVLSIILSMLIAGIFHFVVGRHLFLFAGFIREFDPQVNHRPFTLGRWGTENDELQLLVDQFNAMRERIGRYVIQLTEANQKLVSFNTLLLESEERFRTVLENLPGGIFVHDLNGQFVLVNKAACQNTGYSRDELMRMNVKDIDPASFERGDIFPLWNSLEMGESSIIESKHLRKDGSAYDAEIHINAINIDGEPAIMAIAFDISDRKRAKKERQKLQTQLLQAQKMESLGMLAGGIAHDFNNLLHAMGANLELLGKGKPDDHPDKKRLNSIQKSIDRAAHLVRQMLLFSRKAEIQRQDIDLNREINEAVKIMERSIPMMVNIEFFPEADLWPVNADPVQVEQLLFNLGTNAADAMPDGGSLTIETRNIELDEFFSKIQSEIKPGPYVLMTVSDTGTGMDRQTLTRIFDPFFTTKEVGKGTGLGLASVYGIVKAHGGHIICYSEPGQGTAFKIYWPAAEQAVIESVEKQTEQAVSQGGTETILVVDDDDEIRELTGEVLENSGYQVISASSGEQALEIFEEKHEDIDLVLMDLNMPGMGGSKCTRKMLTLDPSVRVLVASGYSVNGHGMDVLEFGAKDFISKPFRADQLLAKVRLVLGSPK
jgi:PAS domain S-box-containing protein